MKHLKKVLSAGLIRDEKSLLDHTFTLQTKKGKVRELSLIDHLLEMATADKQYHQKMVSTLLVSNLLVQTGVTSERKLKELVNDINITWQRNEIASLSYEDGTLYFELFQNELVA